MLNFRYHIVSLVAVFLALAIGVIMGSTVIDQSLVNRLETQQDQLEDRLQSERETNARLDGRVEALGGELALMSEETGERLAAGALQGVPVLVVGVRGGEPAGLEALQELLGPAGADRRGQLWFTARMALADESERTQLAELVGERTNASAEVLRGAAVRDVTSELRTATATPTDGQAPAATPTIDALLDDGFLELEAADGSEGGEFELVPGTRVLLAVDDQSEVPGDLPVLVADGLVDPGRTSTALPVVAVSATERADDGSRQQEEALVRMRTDVPLSQRVATVDNIDQVVGRLAAVLALQDVADGVTGHYGSADGAARLLPAPAGAAAGG